METRVMSITDYAFPIAIVVLLLWSWIVRKCAYIAELKGYEPTRWNEFYWWGVFWGPLGVLLVVGLPDKTLHRKLDLLRNAVIKGDQT
jgi:hypothetical protein